MSAITIGGDLIHYEVLGRGRPVILLHDWLGSWRYWVPTMQQLGTKYRVYSLDLRGFGDSGKNPQKYALDHQVHLIFDFMRELGLPKAAFIGHGLGALVTSEFARLYGDKVPRMLLISAPLFDPGGLDKRIPAGRAVVPLTDNKAPAEAANAPEATIMNARTAMRAALQEAARARSPVTEPPKPTDPTLAKPEIPLPDLNAHKEGVHNPLLETLGSGLENLLARCFRRTDAEFEKLRADLAKIDAAAVRQSVSDFDSGRMLDRLRLLPMPIVIVHGTDDPVIQPPDENIWNYLTKIGKIHWCPSRCLGCAISRCWRPRCSNGLSANSWTLPTSARWKSNAPSAGNAAPVEPVRALIFANGDMNDGPFLRRVLDAAPGALIVAADGGARLARQVGLQVATAIGDMDSLSAAELADLERAGADIHRFPEEKNETDLELALTWAAERDATWMRVIGGMGDRLDQTISNVYLLALPVLKGRDVRLVAGKQEAWLLHPGESVIEGARGDTVSLIPLGGAAQGIQTENLYYPLQDEPLLFGPARGLSNVMTTDIARVRLRGGLLLVIHTQGRA